MLDAATHTGRITKGVGGLYAVADIKTGAVYSCVAAGIFRLKKIKPVIGDICDFLLTSEDNTEGSITHIHDRRNEIMRPCVSNIDEVMVVAAFDKPKLSFIALDKYLVYLENVRGKYEKGFGISVLINKHDLAEMYHPDFREHYGSAGYDVTYFSAYTGEGSEKLLTSLNNKVCAFTGQSGVGKSSIINALLRNGKMETGILSKKTGRGKHTTRHVELIQLNTDSFILDTPGFSSISIDDIKKSALPDLFPEFAPFFGKCGFSNCVHINEPDCAVKAQVGHSIRNERYNSYISFASSVRN